MTQKFRFYGSSDDNFCYDKMDAQGHWSSGDEIGVYNQSGVWVIEDFGQQGLQVIGTYGGTDGSNLEDGVWSVGIAQLAEEVPLPNWPMTFGVNDKGYSVALEIEVPDSAKVRKSKEHAEGED